MFRTSSQHQLELTSVTGVVGPALLQHEKVDDSLMRRRSDRKERRENLAFPGKAPSGKGA